MMFIGHISDEVAADSGSRWKSSAAVTQGWRDTRSCDELPRRGWEWKCSISSLHSGDRSVSFCRLVIFSWYDCRSVNIRRGQSNLAKATLNVSNVPILYNWQNFRHPFPLVVRGSGLRSSSVPCAPRGSRSIQPFLFSETTRDTTRSSIAAVCISYIRLT